MANKFSTQPDTSREEKKKKRHYVDYRLRWWSVMSWKNEAGMVFFALDWLLEISQKVDKWMGECARERLLHKNRN